MRRVLVVDDDPMIHKLLRRLLQARGYTVEDAYDGEEALGIIARERPDLLVLDLMMPKLSGIEVCQRLKTNPETKGITILILSARGSPQDRDRGLALGADDYVSKPFHVGELLERIEILLKRN